ncbi:MAG: hypothetical protein FD157_985 [Rhodocyclaceae bacterium]|nr:MAG: hypothetical protein FD157_985 [Rhodocyclaceae bacterium]TND06011.1 MAG: hypothetical protein FD118_83 [Rhodocyclaceae bacterium]
MNRKQITWWIWYCPNVLPMKHLCRKVAVVLAIVFGVLSMETQAAEGNDVRNPRFSPDGHAVIFDRCDPDYPDRCRINVYNVNTGTLGYYLAPPGQTWMQAYYSDAGDKLVFVTGPIGDRNLDLFTQRQEVLPNYQIAVMNLDGSKMRVVTSVLGYKGMPAFSHSGKKVIFAMAEKLRDSGKTLAAFWDLWEIDLETGTVGLFAGRFKLFQMGLSVYFPDDERVLLNGDVPMAESLLGPKGSLAKSYGDYTSRYNSSIVFVVKRGQTVLLPPLFTDLGSARGASLDARENTFFVADGGPKEGIRIRRSQTDGAPQSWSYPPHSHEQTTLFGTAVSRDGRFIAGVLSDGPLSLRNRKIMILDTASGVWREIALPRDARQINR